MKALKKPNKRAKAKRYISVFIILFILFFLRTSYKYYKNTASDVVEAGNLTESILLMSEKSAVNIALQHEKQLIEAEKARISELEKRQQKELIPEKNKRKHF